MPFFIVRQDITSMKVDAVVNAANTRLRMGGGVCGAIFRAAGAEKLRAACAPLAPIETGAAVLTPGFALPAKYIIHTAGPVYDPRERERCRALLCRAYQSALELAEANGCGSIAFPLISSGSYGCPKEEALEAARLTIEHYLTDHDMSVYLAVFDKSSFVLSQALLGGVESYIDQHYVDAHTSARRLFSPRPRENMAMDAPLMPMESMPKFMPRSADSMPMAAAAPPRGLDELVAHLDEPFSHTLLKLIDAKGRTDVEVYKRANIDRKLFSKIRTGKGYTPKKPTILALAVALELTLAETNALLRRAGYALSHASKFDVIVEYFIANRKYNIFEINEVLFSYDQPLLGG